MQEAAASARAPSQPATPRCSEPEKLRLEADLQQLRCAVSLVFMQQTCEWDVVPCALGPHVCSDKVRSNLPLVSALHCCFLVPG